MRIGLFDSGIGGLTVLKEFIKKHPNNHYVYFGDTKNMPYGNKSKDELFELADKSIQFLIDKKVDIIIIACGTISSNIDDRFKNKYDVPLIDIISPTIDYVSKFNYDNIGLIATSMTIKSGAFTSGIKDLKVMECPDFVPLIENQQLDSEICDLKIKEYLEPLKKDKIKYLILGCTHYPILENKIRTFFDNDIKLINMGSVLSESLKIKSGHETKLELYFSKINDQLISNVKMIIGDEEIKLK
ncbi:MAG: glutamate racemase [Bacilli bacterium]|nr:glutamate racemase [Bacilli bacterium]